MTRFLAFDYLLALWIYEWLIWMLLWFFRVNFCILRLTSPWPVKRITIWTYALCCRQLDNEELPDIILLCKMIVFDYFFFFCDLIKINIIRLITKPRPDTWCNFRSCDIAWRRGIWQKILAAREFCAFDSP